VHLCNWSDRWTLLALDIMKLEAFHLRCQRQLLRVSWRDHITNEAIVYKQNWRHLQNSYREGVRHYLIISLDLTQLSLHTKPCVCRRTFQQDGIRVSAGRDLSEPLKYDIYILHSFYYYFSSFNGVVSTLLCLIAHCCIWHVECCISKK